MPTNPRKDITLEDPRLQEWKKSVDDHMDEWLGSSRKPDKVAAVKTIKSGLVVGVEFRPLDNRGISEYCLYIGRKRGFNEKTTLLATIQLQPPDPKRLLHMEIAVSDPGDYYLWVTAVKGHRRPKVEGSPAGPFKVTV